MNELESKISDKIQRLDERISTITNGVEYTNAVNSMITDSSAAAASVFSQISFTSISLAPNEGADRYLLILGGSDGFVQMFSSTASITNSVANGVILKGVGSDSFASSNGDVTVEKISSSQRKMTVSYQNGSIQLFENSSDKEKFVYNSNTNVFVTAIDVSE